MTGTSEWYLRRLLSTITVAATAFCGGYLLAGSRSLASSGTLVVGGPPGHLVLEQSHFNLGTMAPGQTAVRTFRFHNAGPGVLQLFKVRTSCGCTAAVPSKKVLAPGESAELEVTFKSGGFKGDVHKEVYLTSNDPKAHRTTLDLEAHIEEVAHLLPDASSLDVARGKVATEHVRLVPTRYGQGLRVRRLESSDPRVAATHLAQASDGSWSFDVTVQSSHPEPSYVATIKVHTTSEVQTSLEYSVVVRQPEGTP